MELVLLLAVLVCPLVMGGMMVAMMRQMRGGRHHESTHDEPSQ